VAELVTKGSNPGVRNALDRLVRQGTVIDRRSGSSILYVANRDHLAWPVIEFAVSTTDSALRTLTDRIAELTRQSLSEPDLSRTTLALFGSVARGSSSTSSDVDIVAVFPSGTPAPRPSSWSIGSPPTFSSEQAIPATCTRSPKRAWLR
jgi:Nucleotidyltransferase domain